jgi:hypothetical protein
LRSSVAVEKGAAGRAPTEPGFTRVRQNPLSRSAKAGLDCRANRGNLIGFLDAFKAVLKAFLAFRTASECPEALSLTRCEDFA